jgi:hypothetical protein
VRLLFHLLISRFTPYYVVSTKDYSLDKEQTSYDDLLDRNLNHLERGKHRIHTSKRTLRKDIVGVQ